MRNAKSLVSMAALLLAVEGAAQRTWIVDALNRPGTDFPDIQAAVNAAAAGDTVRVRDARPSVPGYAGASVSRGIALLGENRPYVWSHSRSPGCRPASGAASPGSTSAPSTTRTCA